jgi:type IV secretory pathway TraG/TraD family ATPase VirD4
LLANCYDQLFFAARDLATTEHLTRRLGTVYRKATSRSAGRGGTTRSTSERRDDLMAPHQIRALKTSLLFHGQAPAARVALRPYYKDPVFVRRLGTVLPPTPAPLAAVPVDDLLPAPAPAAEPPAGAAAADFDETEHSGPWVDFDELAAFLDQVEPTTTPASPGRPSPTTTATSAQEPGA